MASDKLLEAKRMQARAMQARAQPMSPATIAQDTMRREGEAMQRADQSTFQDVRNLAGAVAPYAATAAGTTIGGMMGGPAGMIAGGAVGGSMGARGRQLLRGDPEPTTAEKAVETGMGAASGAVGAIFSKVFAPRPNVRLSFDMQSKAKQVEQEFLRQGGKAAAAGKRGFRSPEAQQLWARSQDVRRIEDALRIARDNPDRIRQQFQRLAGDNRFMRRLAPEQQALIIDVTEQSTPAAILRSLGELRQAFQAGSFQAGTSVATLGTVGALGRGLDRAATRGAVERAMTGISGLPMQAAAPSLEAAAAFSMVPRAVTPDALQQAMIDQLMGRR